MKSETKFVPPRDRTWAEKVREMVVDVLGEPHAWLAEILAASDVLANDSGLNSFRRAVLAWNDFGERHRWEKGPFVLRVLSDLHTIKDEPIPSLSPEGIARALDRMGGYVKNQAINLHEAFAQTTVHQRDEAIKYSNRLASQHLIDPAQLLDFSRVQKWASIPTLAFTSPPNWGLDEAEKEFNDPFSPLFWLTAAPDETIPTIISRMRSSEREGAAAIARGLRYVYRVTLLFGGKDWPGRPRLKWQWLQPIFEELDRLIGDDPRSASQSLRQVWLQYWLILNFYDSKKLDTALGKRVRAAADYELGRLRGLLARAHEAPSKAQFESKVELIANCAEALFRIGNLWDAVRPLLLAFRSLTAPALADDLRYWEEQDRKRFPDPPSPWSAVPDMLVHLFHGEAGREEEHDPQLLDLRSRFARFCLERLKCKVKGGLPVEPNAEWRQAYIRAARELRVNPGGDGHHLLHYASTHDPDPDVREVAKQAYAELRHGPSLPKDLSPRRAFLDAWWWLSQAHLISLGRKVDPDGAQRTREREVRRTTKPATQ